jgi:hypothetical protein
MANNRFNKQSTPKGYQKGGSVKQSPMGSSSTKGNILRGKLKSQKELKKITDSKKYKDASYNEKTKMLNVATMKKGGRIRKMGGGMMMQRPMMKKGGSLKPVNPKTQKGLSKLPTEVRNKMGYMQDGGKVKKPAAGLFKFDKQTFLQFKDLMTGSSDAEINKKMKILKDSLEKEKKKEKKSNGK